jgi:hypothetical protein
MLAPGSRLLFVDDDFAPDSWSLLMTLQLLYKDVTIDVKRMHAMPDQQPGQPLGDFDHVFSKAGGRYEEFDNENVAESIRLHTLRYYSVGFETRFANLDHSAYVVSGIMDGGGYDSGRWTEPRATLKFRVPARGSTVLTTDFYVADLLVTNPPRTLSIFVGGSQVGIVQLTHEGEQRLRWPIESSLINPPTKFTMVDFAVDNPYTDADGQAFGVVLTHVGFEFPVQ